MKKALIALATLSGLLVLGACSVTNPNYQQPRNQLGIDGSWRDANGIVSSFRSGIFETRAPDTNEKLSEGNYRMVNSQLVEIEMRSIVRGTVSRVNCALVNSTQLNCTGANGSQFSLIRSL